MSDDSNTADLVARWRRVDQQAATEFFQRCAGKLISLVQTNLSAQLAQRLGPEYVVQSAYRSFFAGAREGRYDLPHSGNLWRHLVSITLHKLHNQVRPNTARKRDTFQQMSSEDDLGVVPADLLSQGPCPLEAVALVDEVSHAMSCFTPLQRQVFELRLQGHSVPEIAAAVIAHAATTAIPAAIHRCLRSTSNRTTAASSAAATPQPIPKRTALRKLALESGQWSSDANAARLAGVGAGTAGRLIRFIRASETPPPFLQ
jgi:RNA polymerase sigma-70 factor (ECF subfamily)